MAQLYKTLLVLSGLVVVLPPGWCCFFGVGSCCQRDRVDLDRQEPSPACHDCCRDQSGSTPAKKSAPSPGG